MLLLQVQLSTKIICEGCNKKFEPESLLKHIASKKPCKEKYGERYDVMKKENRKSTYKKARMNSNREAWMDEAKDIYENHKEIDIPESPFDYSYALKCEGCNKPLLAPNFLRHVSHSESCKAVYGDRFETMKKEKTNWVHRQKYKRRKEKKKEQMKAYDKKNAEKISERKSAKYNEKKLETYLKAEKAKFEKPVLTWKDCRLKDHENFQNSVEEDQMKQDLATMKDRIVQFVQRHLDKIETTYDEAKGLSEADAKQKMNHLTPYYAPGLKGMYVFKTELTKLDKELEEIAKRVNGKLSCFACARSDKPPCFECLKQRIRERPKEDDEFITNEFTIRGFERKPVQDDAPVKDNTLVQDDVSFPIKAPMSQKGKKIGKMIKKTTKGQDSPPCQIKKKPIIRKRKKIDFTMEEFEDDVQNESDEDFVVTKKRH